MPKNWLIKAQRYGPQSHLMMKVWNSDFVIDYVRHIRDTNMKPGKTPHRYQIQISCVDNGEQILKMVTLRSKCENHLKWMANLTYRKINDRLPYWWFKDAKS